MVDEEVNDDSLFLWADSHKFGPKDINDVGLCSFQQNNQNNKVVGSLPYLKKGSDLKCSKDRWSNIFEDLKGPTQVINNFMKKGLLTCNIKQKDISALHVGSEKLCFDVECNKVKILRRLERI